MRFTTEILKWKTVQNKNYVKKYNKKVQLKDKNNITNNLILIKNTKSYPTLKTILKSNS